MHGKYLRKIQLPYLHFLLQFDHNSCEATAIVAESENASTATEPDAGQSETNAETERTETTEVITEDSQKLRHRWKYQEARRIAPFCLSLMRILMLMDLDIAIT